MRSGVAWPEGGVGVQLIQQYRFLTVVVLAAAAVLGAIALSTVVDQWWQLALVVLLAAIVAVWFVGRAAQWFARDRIREQGLALCGVSGCETLGPRYCERCELHLCDEHLQMLDQLCEHAR